MVTCSIYAIVEHYIELVAMVHIVQIYLPIETEIKTEKLPRTQHLAKKEQGLLTLGKIETDCVVASFAAVT